VVACAVEDGHLRYLSHGLAPSGGWNKGRIVDGQAVADSIAAALADAERDAGITIESATIGIGGAGVQGAQGRGLCQFGRPREVDESDLRYAAEAAADVRLEHDRTLLHVFPQDFVLDGLGGYRKPQKSLCSRLEANVHLVTTQTQEYESVVQAAHEAHVVVEEVVFEPVAQAYGALLPEERSRGVALLDIGLQSSSLVVYDGDACVLATGLPISADHFTRDIGYVFKVSYEDAEALKQQYGCAITGLTAESTLIEIPMADGRPSREAKRYELVETLEARAEQLFDMVHTEIRRANMDRKLFEGIVLSGGGALLNGMCDMAERILNCSASNALVKGIGEWPDNLDSPVWTCAAGLAMYSAKLKLHRPAKRAGAGLLSLVMR